MTKNNPIKFFIFTTQRSGSSWLVSLLNSHPDIKAFHEIFLEKPSIEKNLPQFHIYRQNNPARRPLATFRYLKLLDSYPVHHETIGYKVMYNQLIRCPELLAAFAIGRYRIIHLVRDNHLDRFISSESMRESGLEHSKVEVKAKPVEVDTDNLIKYLSWQEKQVKLARLILRLLPNQAIEISYDDLTSNNEDTMSELSKFLRVNKRQHSFTSQRRKIHTGSLENKISNYSQVKETLAGTRFERFVR